MLQDGVYRALTSYGLYLSLNDIASRHARVRRPQTNCFVARFDGTVLDEFLRLGFRETR